MVVHGLRGRASNRKISEAHREKIYRGFGPTLASEYQAKKHKLVIGRRSAASE